MLSFDPVAREVRWKRARHRIGRARLAARAITLSRLLSRRNLRGPGSDGGDALRRFQPQCDLSHDHGGHVGDGCRGLPDEGRLVTDDRQAPDRLYQTAQCRRAEPPTFVDPP